MNKFKMKALLMTSIITIGVFGSALSASAASVTTTEFGTLTYSLTRSGNSVTALTSTTKSASKLITKLEIQLNSTGATIYNSGEISKSNATNNTVVKATNYSSEKLAAFTTHEARGNSSVAKYLSSTF